MRSFFTIGLVTLIVSAGLGQKKVPFKKSSFGGVQLSDSWIVVKYKDLSSQSLPRNSVSLSRPDHSLASRTANSKPSILDGMVKIPITAGQDPLEICNQYINDPNVVYAEPIIMDRPLETVSDPLSSNQYHLDIIQAFDAWDITTGDDDISIGIIDTGIDLDHEDLIDKIWLNEDDPIDGVDNDENGYIDDYYGYDFADIDNDPDTDESVHGARVAGIAGASTNNEIGIAGIGYNTKIAALKGFKSESGFSSGLFEAILYAADNDIDILNLSWGSIRSPLQSEQDIIDYAVLEKDVVIVAAAGNEGGKSTEERKFYPASYENVLSVAGSNSSDTKWAGSTFNFAVDITAPGAAIVSTSTGNGYNTSGGYGTSFAAPMVAAAAALVKDQFPELTSRQIMERVRATADDIYEIGGNSAYEGKLGKGRLNVYRAVNESSVKSLRGENPELISSNGDFVFYGDTVMVTIQLTNFLRQVNNPSVYITATDNEFEVSQGSFFPGLMGTMDEQEISFEVVLSEDLVPESTVGIRLDFADGSYSDFQYLDVTTSPDYVNFGNDNLTLTIEGDGGIGLVEYGSDQLGSGLVYGTDTLLRYSGIMLTTSEESVSDNIISSFTELTRENDFSVSKFYKLYHHPRAALFGYSEFEDDTHAIKIEQSNIASESDDFLIIRYRLVNTSDQEITNLSFGLYNDWDLDNYLENSATFDVDEEYLFTQNSTANLFAGSKVIGSGTTRYSAIDIDNQNGNTEDVSNSFSDQEKYDFLVNQSLASAGTVGTGNDVAGIQGLTIDQLGAFSDAYVDVIYAVGSTQEELESTLNTAVEYLNTIIDNPRVLEVFYTCDGSNVILNPSEGDSYEFYEDPRGLNLLDTGSSYATGTIVQDTSFYVRNIDNNYPSDFFEVRVRLLNDFADFSVSEDTLYMDESYVTIQFTDQSIGASSWSWDFGQGTFSSIQNPIISLNEAGSYTVSLTVENEQGCTDSITKDIVVANRAESLSFDDYQVCPGEFITISNPSASSLKMFTSQNQANPILHGETLEVGPFNSDSTLFISAIVDGFETGKSEVLISTFPLNVDFSFSPDTASSDNQINITAEVDQGTSLAWTVNGEGAGSSNIVTISAQQSTIDASLQVTSSDGCVITIEKSFTVSTSPTPSVSDLEGCLGDTLSVAPSNGEIFGFYEDSELTSLIKKGSELKVAENSKIYVVGLDDGLPGNSVEVDISFIDFSPSISYNSSVIGGKNRVEFSLDSPEEITSYRWYVDDELTETVSNPILFFDDVLTTITVEVTNSLSCIASDTVTLDFTPVITLGVNTESDVKIFPNPTKDLLNIVSDEDISSIELLSLSGKLIQAIEHKQNQIDLGNLKSGIYILSFEFDNKANQRLKLILE